MRKLIFIMMFLLVGCDKTTALSNFNEKNFQIISAQDGSAYRLNSATGQVSLITTTGIKPINETAITLEIGKIYTLENNATAIYEGKGIFNTNTRAIADSIISGTDNTGSNAKVDYYKKYGLTPKK